MRRQAPDSRGSPAATTSALRRLVAGTVAAVVDPEHGGLLASVRIGDEELLAPAVPGRTGVPRGGSFVLAPWVGELFEGRLPFRGEEHRMPTDGSRHAIHGLVFTGPWDVEHHDERTLGLRRDLVAPWPFGGTARQTFELDAGGLTQILELTAASSAMPVSVGWHPWFRVADPDRVSVAVRAERHLELDAELIPTGRTLAVEGPVDLRDGPVLGTRRIDVVYVDVDSPARLNVHGWTIDIAFDPSIRFVVVYVSDGSVCIEPWTAWPDAPNATSRGNDSGQIVLEAGETLRRWMRWGWSRT